MAVAPNSPHTRDIASFIYPFTNLAEHEKVEPQMVTPEYEAEKEK